MANRYARVTIDDIAFLFRTGPTEARRLLADAMAGGSTTRTVGGYRVRLQGATDTTPVLWVQTNLSDDSVVSSDRKMGV